MNSSDGDSPGDVNAPAISLAELHARMVAAGITIPENRMTMVCMLLADALAPLHRVNAPAMKTCEPAVAFQITAACGAP